MKIMTIVGARPQFIKAVSVSESIRKKESISEIILHTGQHYDESMSGVFFKELGIPQPSYNLGIGGGTHGQNTGRMIEQIEQVIIKESPDWLLLYGDTDSTLAGAIAASKLNIPIAHVEAGLRSFNRKMPEELNRILTDHASNHLFAPTQSAVDRLLFEGIPLSDITFSGDVMFDTALHFGELSKRQSKIISTLKLKDKNFILATIHRKENTDDPIRLTNIIKGLSIPTQKVILPLHPRTRKKISEFNIKVPSNITTIEPIGYLDMVRLEISASVIATDSGGVQKEAFFHGVPCVTLREETEWVELVELGVNHLAGADSLLIGSLIQKSINQTIPKVFPYGEGNASEIIAKFFEQEI